MTVAERSARVSPNGSFRCDYCKRPEREMKRRPFARRRVA